MARFDIMSRNGQTVRYRGAPKYNGLFGKPSYIEFAEIASPTPIEWQVGDYVDYSRTGFRYKLYTIPQVVKSATSGTAGDAFVYKNVQFFCATKDLEIALFRDIVEYDNGMHFSSIPNVDTYEDVYGIINRIQANMDDFAPGQWTIRAMSTSYSEITNLMSEVRAFSLADGTCMDALNQIYALWKGLSWIYKVENGRHTIVIGRPNLQDASNTTPEFSYGEDCGLKVITRAVSTKNEMATRIYAYGSDRNLPTRYYNNLEPHIKDYESVYIPHLMLPLSDWGTTGGAKDARLAYLEDSSARNKYGLIPKVMRFDGTGDLEEIYPSVEGMTIGDVVEEGYPGTGYSSDERIDQVLACDNPIDTGQYTEDSIKLKEDAFSFVVEDYEVTYGVSANQEAATIGNERALFDSHQSVNAGGTEGHFVIKMNNLAGFVRCDPDTSDILIADILEEMPKAFVEVYIDDVLQVSTEAKVQGANARVRSAFAFECPVIKFNTYNNGYLKIFLRVEMKLLPSTPAVDLIYTLTNTTVTIRNEYTLPKTFTIYLKQLGFDLNELGVSNEGLGTLSMTSGMCAGREFVINSAYHNSLHNYWVLECQRQDDTTIMQYFPNNVYTINEDDTFVILDIQLPEKFVTAAMTRLHNAAADALSRMNKPVMAYSPEVDSKAVFMATVTLTEGLYMPVYDPDLISTFIPSEPHVNWILIDTVTIAENEDVIPIYGVTLRDEKVDSMLQIITGELNETLKRLRDRDTDESRIPAREDPDTVIVPTIVGVQILCDTKFFVADADGGYTDQFITLTAKTTGINTPRYQWYYKLVTVTPGEQEGDPDVIETEWVALEDETAQTYDVLAESEIYFQEDRTYEDFMVKVCDVPENESPTEDTEYFSDVVRISKGGRGPKGDDGDPGSDGYSRATITLYQRFPTGTPSNTRVGNTTYTFSTQMLTGTLNGWSSTPPSGSGPIYVTTANVSSQDDTVSIRGGWTTDSPAGDWTPPARWTGENGLMGKVMRGVNVWELGGLTDGRGAGVDGYQGLDEVDPSIIFYDVVAKLDSDGNITNYYYCKDGSNGNAALYAPWSTQGQAYWEEAENFDFIATKVLIASNAFIDVFSSNACYLYDNDGPASGNIVAGIQGGSTDSLGNYQINFFAGTHYRQGESSDDNVLPQDAPFRVYYDGNVYMSKGVVGPYTIGAFGIEVDDWSYQIPGESHPHTVATSYRANGFYSSDNNNDGDVYYANLNPLPAQGLTIDHYENNVRTEYVNILASGVYTDGGVYASEIMRSGEDVITFNSGSIYSDLGSILHVVHCTQNRYDYLDANNLLDAHTFYVITTS